MTSRITSDFISTSQECHINRSIVKQRLCHCAMPRTTYWNKNLAFWPRPWLRRLWNNEGGILIFHLYVRPKFLTFFWPSSLTAISSLIIICWCRSTHRLYRNAKAPATEAILKSTKKNHSAFRLQKNVRRNLQISRKDYEYIFKDSARSMTWHPRAVGQHSNRHPTLIFQGFYHVPILSVKYWTTSLVGCTA